MLIDRSQVSDDGLELNKIGVSFTAFRNMPNACVGRVGEGLSNQLDDYHNVCLCIHYHIHLFQRDIAKQSSGRVGDYFVGNFGQPVFERVGEQYSLGYVLQQPQSSVVTLAFVADHLQYIVNTYVCA